MILKRYNSKIEIVTNDDEELKKAKKLLNIYYPHPKNREQFQSVYIGRKNSFPSGYLAQFEIKAKKKNLNYTIEDHRNYSIPRIKLSYNSPYELMAHQQKALNAIKEHEVGIISSPTGSGKGQIIGGAIAERSVVSLIICPTDNIKNSLTDTLKEIFGDRHVSSEVPVYPWMPGIDKKNIIESDKDETSIDKEENPFDYLLKPKKKTKPENKFEAFKQRQLESMIRKRDSNKWFKSITVICWHSIHLLPKEFVKRIGCIIIDECHTASIKDIRNLLFDAENAIFRYGTSATPWRDQPHLFKLMQAALGSEVIYDYPIEDAIEDNVVAKPNLNIMEAAFPTKFLKKTRDFRQLVDWGVIRNKARNTQIVKKAIELYDDNNRVFVAIDEIAQFEGKSICKIKKINGIETETWELEEDVSYSLKSIFEEFKVPVVFISGDDTSKSKKQKIEELKEIEGGFIVVGTYAIGIGTDIPSINKIIMGSISTKNASIKFIQRIGRGMRTSGEVGKELEVFDFMDRWSPLTKKYTIDRVKIFAKYYKGCKIFGF